MGQRAQFIRLPLQVGTSSLTLLARALATLIPSFVVVMLAPILALGIVGTRNVGTAQILQYGFWIGGSLAIVRAFRLLASAYRRRPSDVLLDHDTVRVDGGRHHAFELGWKEVQPATWSLEPVKGTSTLRTGTGSETDLVFAETEDFEEQRSLADLLESLQSIARSKTGEGGERAAPERTAPPGVLSCPKCGAPTSPADSPAVVCDYCASECAVPDVLRARIRDARAQAEREVASTVIVARLLDQMRAPAAARLLVGAAAMMIGAWLVAFGAMFVHLWNGTLDAEKAFVLAAFPMALIFALFCALRASFANRSALSLLAFHLGAGTTPAGKPACRRCAGPLAAPATGRPIVACAYCGAENVLGLELVRGSSIEQEHYTLEATLAGRRTQRLVAARLGVAAGLLVVIACVLLARGA